MKRISIGIVLCSCFFINLVSADKNKKKEKLENFIQQTCTTESKTDCEKELNAEINKLKNRLKQAKRSINHLAKIKKLDYQELIKNKPQDAVIKTKEDLTRANADRTYSKWDDVEDKVIKDYTKEDIENENSLTNKEKEFRRDFLLSKYPLIEDEKKELEELELWDSERKKPKETKATIMDVSSEESKKREYREQRWNHLSTKGELTEKEEKELKEIEELLRNPDLNYLNEEINVDKTIAPNISSKVLNNLQKK